MKMIVLMTESVQAPRRIRCLFAVLFCVAFAAPSAAALEPSQVLILVNKDTGISSQVAHMYQKLRNIPESNVLRLSLGSDRQINTDEYWKKAAPAVKEALENSPNIRCILTTAGVPYVIRAKEGQDPGSTFDSELAAVLREQPGERKRMKPNPLFLQGGNPFAVRDPRLFQMVFVSRLDGPDLKTITRMVEDAVSTEKTGLDGPVFGDTQGSQVIGGAGLGDTSIRAAIDELAGAGFASKIDMKPESWTQPKGAIGDQAAGAAFYVGWYNLGNFQNIFGAQGLARGSIAWHIASSEAVDIWNVNSGFWCINLIHRGAAVTIGPAFEPYLQAFPNGGIFTEGLLAGLSVAESYWLALPHVSWAMVLLGDPLYRPFGLNPRPALLARAYEKDGGDHVLKSGETAGLLTLIECVGPPGSTTPAMKASAEPELGLAGASGEVEIPPLKPGQTAVIRIPRVTAGPDPTGLFRLRLSVQSDDASHRAIILEGRIGFSKLTGGLYSKAQLSVSPDGEAIISGLPGRTFVIRPDALRLQPINAPAGFILTGTEFSPDSRHVAVRIENPQDRKSAVLIVDSELKHTQSLPAGSQFLKWLGKDQVLLKDAHGLVRHPITSEPDHVFPAPGTWPGGPAAGTVIEGTNIQFLVGPDRTILSSSGDEPFREILRETKATHSLGIAHDLSVFAAVDDIKNLWVQRGFGAKPEIVARDVQQVVWGPISHRVLVQDNKNTRVYDARDGSWINLGTVAAAYWSPDEQRLLYVDASSQSLNLLTNRTVDTLCSLSKIGPLAAAAFTADGRRAFLLAGVAGPLDVWEIGLPPKPAQ